MYPWSRPEQQPQGSMKKSGHYRQKGCVAANPDHCCGCCPAGGHSDFRRAGHPQAEQWRHTARRTDPFRKHRHHNSAAAPSAGTAEHPENGADARTQAEAMEAEPLWGNHGIQHRQRSRRRGDSTARHELHLRPRQSLVKSECSVRGLP